MPPITYSIPVGPVVTLNANQVYALPGIKVVMYAEGPPSMQQSNTLDFAVSSAVTFDGNQAELASAFVRSTTNAVVRIVGE